jgi:hypothetical protein
LPDTYWPEYLPWQEPRFWLDAKADAQNRQRFGKFYWKSQFRSLDKCGCLATRKACECGNFNVNNCALPCTEPACKAALYAINLDKSERKVDDPAFQPLECDLNCSGCQSEAENEFLARQHGFEPDVSFSTPDQQRDYWVPKTTLIEKAMQCDSLSCDSLVRPKAAKQSFRVNQTLLATPSGRVKPISESMTGVVQSRHGHASRSQRRFIPQQKSVFSRQGVPGQFANSTTTRTRGAPDGVRWIGQAICSNVAQQPKTCCSFD